MLPRFLGAVMPATMAQNTRSNQSVTIGGVLTQIRNHLANASYRASISACGQPFSSRQLSIVLNGNATASSPAQFGQRQPVRLDHGQQGWSALRVHLGVIVENNAV